MALGQARGGAGALRLFGQLVLGCGTPILALPESTGHYLDRFCFG